MLANPTAARMLFWRQQRAKKITIRKARLGVEAECLDREFWAQMSPDERVKEAWRLSLEPWEMKAWDAGEPGCCRKVARVIRPGTSP